MPEPYPKEFRDEGALIARGSPGSDLSDSARHQRGPFHRFEPHDRSPTVTCGFVPLLGSNSVSEDRTSQARTGHWRLAIS
jgi:hypothetical protein